MKFSICDLHQNLLNELYFLFMMLYLRLKSNLTVSWNHPWYRKYRSHWD